MKMHKLFAWVAVVCMALAVYTNQIRKRPTAKERWGAAVWIWCPR